MLNTIKKTNTRKSGEGFTIIEVMIVLAIAALIILIVLLAIPALKRSSRNTSIKSDASALAAGIGDFQSNNNGASPTKFVDTNGSVSIQNATISTGATAQIQSATTINGSTTGANFAVKTVPVAANVSAGALYVDSGESCQGTGGAPTASSRAFAIYYWVESSGVIAGKDANTGIINGAGLKGQCLDS